MGSWLTYGLGSETKDLPAFVVFNSGQKGPSAGSGNWNSGFLPTLHSGVEFRSSGEPVLYLSNPPGMDEQTQRNTLNAVNELNRKRLDVAENPVHVHDPHATILHLLGFDHKRLTYRFHGRDYRLTDVHGELVQGILA